MSRRSRRLSILPKTAVTLVSSAFPLSLSTTSSLAHLSTSRYLLHLPHMSSPSPPQPPTALTPSEPTAPILQQAPSTAASLPAAPASLLRPAMSRSSSFAGNIKGFVGDYWDEGERPDWMGAFTLLGSSACSVREERRARVSKGRTCS
jgi:hypothetical protein